MDDSPLQLLWGLGLLVMTIVVALWQRVETAMGLAVAGVRALLQMVVFAYLVAIVVELDHPAVSLVAVGLLLGVAAVLTQNQVLARLPIDKLPIARLAAVAMLLGSAVSLVYTLVVVVQPQPWYSARVLLPFTSVILANAMGGAAIAGERLIQTLERHATDIELHLSLGATPEQAIAAYRQEALQAALLPIVSNMTVMGLGVLPTFMAGSLLGGFEPLRAGAYQLLLTFMALLTTLITVLLFCWGIKRQFFNASGQLLRW
jgi:putative ABC transport system permease protein